MNNLHKILLFVFLSALLVVESHHGAVAEAFPLASCKAADGTITRISGRNTSKASLWGRIAEIDIREECVRDPGGVTTQYGGKLTVNQCVQQLMRGREKERLYAEANCDTGAIFYSSSGKIVKRTKFPLPSDADTSCASGIPPMQRQFQILCPSRREMAR